MHGAGSASAGAELVDSIRAHPLAAAYALLWVTATVTSERNISHPLFAHTVQQLSAVLSAVVQAQPLLLLEALSVWQVQRGLLLHHRVAMFNALCGLYFVCYRAGAMAGHGGPGGDSERGDRRSALILRHL
jgi:hypothetical protein